MLMLICCLRHQRAKMCEKGSERWCSFVVAPGEPFTLKVGPSDAQEGPRSGRAISPHTAAEDMRPAHLLNVWGNVAKLAGEHRI